MRVRVRNWIVEMRKRVAGLGVFAFAMLVGLLCIFVFMALEHDPPEMFAVVSMAIGGFTLLIYVDRMISARAPSRSIVEGGRASIVGVLCYIFGLTILSFALMFRPINIEGVLLTDTMRLYVGTAGGILLLCGVCSALYIWRRPPQTIAGTLPGIIEIGGGTFASRQVTDLRSGICPRCGKRMEPIRMEFDNTQRWFCSHCNEFFAIRPGTRA